MLTKLLQMLFVPKRARTKMAARRTAPAKLPPPRDRQGAPEPAGGDRDKLMTDVMAVYRQQREDVYDTLDEATKRQIEEDAEKAFGQVLRPKG